MNKQSPHTAGSARTLGKRLPERSNPYGLQAQELRERLAAIVDGLRILDADQVDVPLTLAESLVEDIEAAA